MSPPDSLALFADAEAPDCAVAAHDPGGKVRIALPAGMGSCARFSPCGRYRPLLRRWWGPAGKAEPYALWIGMNPSTASAMVDDPTVRREVGFTMRWGLRGYAKANVMDYRATHPRDLLAPGVEPRSAENLHVIRDLALGAERIVLAFGAVHPRLVRHVEATLEALAELRRPLLCLGTTRGGLPRHPLYLRGDSELRIWSGLAMEQAKAREVSECAEG